jgi:opacity protein-like surface antigen
MKMFKAILLAAAVMGPLSMASHAADLGPDEAPAVSDPSLIGLYLRGDIGWSFLDVSGADNDDNFVAGGGIGYQFTDYFRADITADWSGDYSIAPGAEISTTTLLGNAYLDWANDSMFTPYVGAGIGWGWVDGSGTAASDDGLALGAAAGVAIDVTNNLAVDMGYRFRNIDVSGGDTQEHQATVGMRVKF